MRKQQFPGIYLMIYSRKIECLHGSHAGGEGVRWNVIKIAGIKYLHWSCHKLLFFGEVKGGRRVKS